MTIDDRKVFTDSKDFTLSNLREMFDEGDIIINPDYGIMCTTTKSFQK